MAYLDPDDIRTQYPSLTETVASDEALVRYVAEFEDIAERYTGVAYEPREVTETADLSRTRKFFTQWPEVTAVSELTVDTDDVTTDYTFTNGWSIDLGANYTGVLSVTYTHGHASPPVAILSACYEYVRARALADNSRVPRDVISQSGDGFTTRYATPDWSKGRPTGYTEVDRLLNSVTRYRLPVG